METIIFRTLMHSLWQGVVLAVLTALILMLGSRASAKLRYNLLITGFILFSISMMATFSYEWQQSATAKNTVVLTMGQLHALPTASEAAAPALQEKPLTWINNSLNYFSAYSNTIVLIWFLVILAKSIQLFAGLYAVKRIRNTSTTRAGDYWESRLNALALQFGINQTVGILQSGIAKVPMVVGHFKPLVLIPLGLLNGLSEAEVESILCHELAHIKRRDYLVNILQSFMEVVFFFNPAVLWVSKLIREERESCCDDMAISQTNNKVGYISALISCQEFQQLNPQYAMAMSGPKDHLVERVKRMVSHRSPGLNRIEKGILALSLVSAVLLTAAFTDVKTGSTEQHKSGEMLQDTTKKKKALRKLTKTITRIDGLSGEEIPASLEPLSPPVPNAPVSPEVPPAPPESADDYTENYDPDRAVALASREKAIENRRIAVENRKIAVENLRIAAEHKQLATENKARAIRDLQEHQLSKRTDDIQMKKANEAFKELDAKIQENDKKMSALDRLTIDEDRKLAIADRKLAIADRKLATLGEIKNRERRISNETMRLTTRTNSGDAVTNRHLAEADAARVKAQVTTVKSTSTTARTGISADYFEPGEPGEELSNTVKSEMLKDGLIKNDKNLSYKLDIKELIINGKKMPLVTHEKYKKYLKRKDWALVYNYKINN